MKNIIRYILIFISIQVNANMAEPVERGTILGRPFLNQYVDITHEDLHIKIDSSFNIASFEITYNIRALKDGIKIPFLFYASDLRDDFVIYIDNKKIKLSTIPSKYSFPNSFKFKDFEYFFNYESPVDYQKMVLIEDRSNGGVYHTINDFLYFETDISQGEHLISATYSADKWTDGWDWVNVYSFRYALSPAKYWKSFGSLSITIDATEFNQSLTTNIGQPSTGDINNIAKWEFDSIPTEILKINFQPEIGAKAQSLLKLGTARLASIIGIILFILHVLLIYTHRRNNHKVRFSWIVISGSLIFPLIFLFTWVELYDIFDNIIGEHASREHGYGGTQIILYPILMPIYWLIIWLTDRLIKRKIIKTHYNIL